MGESLVNVKNNRVHVPILNATEKDFVVDNNFKTEYSGFDDYVTFNKEATINKIIKADKDERLEKLLIN